MTHTITIVPKPGTTGWGGGYLARCSCGWKSLRSDLLRDAESVGLAHVREQA